MDGSKLSREDSQWTEAKKSLLTNHVFDLVCFHVDKHFFCDSTEMSKGESFY